MKAGKLVALILAICTIAGLAASYRAFGNGGPFLVKYPGGDPAAKGVLARLDPSLKPMEENRLRVVKENLTVVFQATTSDSRDPPIADVTATYIIFNPTNEEIQVDFGFPILRGIYVRSLGDMGGQIKVHVTVDDRKVNSTVISNSAIYGMIRENACKVIEKAVAADTELAKRIADMKGEIARSKAALNDLPSRKALQEYLTTKLKWNDHDTMLMVAYSSLDFGAESKEANPGLSKNDPRDRWFARFPGIGFGGVDQEKDLHEISNSHLGPLEAIGEQKATQLYAQLASRFDKEAANSYESIFMAWGGDVRERALDMVKGNVRPREANIPEPINPKDNTASEQERPTRQRIADPTVYARIDYLDPKVDLSTQNKACCETILKNLSVVFTYAPMNLLYYGIKFPARDTRVVTITYQQYAYTDTLAPASYQLAYVLHPATMWKDFGPINLTVEVPAPITPKASLPLREVIDKDNDRTYRDSISYKVYSITLTDPKDKKGELFIAVDKADWMKEVPRWHEQRGGGL
jgi:hypothetical protein